MKINIIRLQFIFLALLIFLGVLGITQITNILEKEAEAANFLKTKAEYEGAILNWAVLFLLNSHTLAESDSLNAVIDSRVDVVSIYDSNKQLVNYNVAYANEGDAPISVNDYIRMTDAGSLIGEGYAFFPVEIDRHPNALSTYEDEIFSSIEPIVDEGADEVLGYIVVHIDTDELISNSLQKRSYVYYGVAIIILVLTSLFLVDSYIGRPIRRLDKQLTAVYRDDGYKEIPLDGILLKEVHNLACNFIEQHKNAMEVNEKLESLVKERTDELEQLTIWLRKHAYKSSRESDDAARRIAAEVHDVLGPKILTLKNNIDINLTKFDSGTREYNEFQNALASIHALNDAARNIISRYRLSTAEYLGLEAGLEDVVEYVCSGGTELETWEFVNNSEMLDEICSDAHPEIIKTVQEALMNVVKHSSANHVLVLVDDCGENIAISVKDNGHGFVYENSIDSHGISIMKERAGYIDSTFSIASGAMGTEVVLKVPMSV